MQTLINFFAAFGVLCFLGICILIAYLISGVVSDNKSTGKEGLDDMV